MRSNTGRVTATLLLFVLSTAGSALAAETGQVARLNGIDVFYGVIPGEILSGHPADHDERKMHGGDPRGRGQHHLIVSFFDVKTGAGPHTADQGPRTDAVCGQRHLR